MFSAYLFCLLVGGFFVVTSAIGGADDGDVSDGHVHLDAGGTGHHLQLDMQTDLAHLPASGHHHEPTLPARHAPTSDVTASVILLSFRFWTYAACFFGLTGVLLSTLTATGAIATGVLSVGVGVACGVTASMVLRAMRRHSTSSDVSHDDLVGATGTLLMPLEPGRTGKVRIERRGHFHDLLARSGEREALAADVPVVVIGFEKDEAIVVHAGRLLGDDTTTEGDV